MISGSKGEKMNDGWIKPSYKEKRINGIDYYAMHRFWQILLLKIVKDIQLILWCLGIAVHDPIFGECTPDFNCCENVGRKAGIKISKQLIRSWSHKLFQCPTFWRLKPAFKCPICGKQYRCYWDGHDEAGYINLCTSCFERMRK